MAAPISLRLSNDKWQLYSDLAQAEGVGLSTYLKLRLERDDHVTEELASLRRVLESVAVQRSACPDGKSGQDETPPSQVTETILLELLLLMRSVVGEAKLSVVHGELRRRNLPIFSGDTGSRK